MPLGVYVHWPYCAKICPYCDFNVFKTKGREAEGAALVRAIIADLEGQARLTGPRALVSIFFGGGTPSLMDPAAVAEIIATARRLWSPAASVEVSLEANPTDAEAARFEALAAAGVNRLSLGLQALDDVSLKFLGRNHNADQARRAAGVAARVFPRLSLDLIYARPGQTVGAWAEELRAAVGLGAEHLSPYQLTIEAGTAFGRAVARGAWTPPDEDLAADLYDTTQAVLEAEGFEAYEVSNHARGNAARSTHNLVYWRGRDYVGVGPGAHGRIMTDSGRLATEGTARPSEYIAQVQASGVGFSGGEILSVVEQGEERLLSGLRILDGVPFDELVALDLSAQNPKVRELVDLGLLVPDSMRLRATANGRRVLDRVTRDLVL